MRRAVAACTSPEVVFGSGRDQQSVNNQAYSAGVVTDPLDLAMEHLQLSSPAVEVSRASLS